MAAHQATLRDINSRIATTGELRALFGIVVVLLASLIGLLLKVR